MLKENLGEGLIATYQSKLDYDMLAVMNKAGIERDTVDPKVKSASCLRLTSDGVKDYGDLLPWFYNAIEAIEAFTKEFLGYLVKARMMDGKATRELTWKKAPTMMYSVDGWAVVSWIVRDVWGSGGVVSGEYNPFNPLNAPTRFRKGSRKLP